jgi:type IV pilus biogenesis protein CpaD/CtpE
MKQLPIRAVALLCLAATLVAACASPGAARRSDAGPRPDPDVITADEFAPMTGTTLYDVVRSLRPAWILRSRPTALLAANQAQLIVYVDGTRYGNMDSLRQLTPNGVATVRYYSPSNAEARFGPGHLLGAIEVTTLRH